MTEGSSRAQTRRPARDGGGLWRLPFDDIETSARRRHADAAARWHGGAASLFNPDNMAVDAAATS